MRRILDNLRATNARIRMLVGFFLLVILAGAIILADGWTIRNVHPATTPLPLASNEVRAQVKTAMQTYFHAWNRGDAKYICSILSQEIQRDLYDGNISLCQARLGNLQPLHWQIASIAIRDEKSVEVGVIANGDGGIFFWERVKGAWRISGMR